MQIEASIRSYEQNITRIRRELHRIPEAGFEEFKTSKYIKEYLEAHNIPYEVMGKTG